MGWELKWADLSHEFPGLKMSPTPALLAQLQTADGNKQLVNTLEQLAAKDAHILLRSWKKPNQS